MGDHEVWPGKITGSRGCRMDAFISGQCDAIVDMIALTLSTRGVPMTYRNQQWRLLRGKPWALVRAAISIALVAALIAASLRFPYLDHATVALLLLGAVVGIGALWGTLNALVAAVAGGIGFDYYYLPPYGMAIEKPEHWIALAIFLIVAASTGHLASRLKRLVDKRTSLTQLSLEPLCIADLNGNLESANVALVNLLGRPQRELLSRSLVDFAHSADRPATEAAIKAATASVDSPIEVENRFQTREGEWRWLRWRIAGSGESWLSAAARDITEEKWAQEKLRALADQVISAQEEERRRIARELHDDCTQRLAAVSIELGLLKRGREAQDDGALDKELTRVQGEVLSLSEDIRQLSHSLHPSVLEHSTLKAALEAYCREFARQTGIETTFTERNVPDDIPRPVALAFYRIAQEALRNVSLHSEGTAASVVLSGPILTLNVIDNGRGFDTAVIKKSPGLGLVSIEERGRLAGAIVTISSIPGEGTTISAEIRPKDQVPK